jgi:hypothetical protein
VAVFAEISTVETSIIRNADTVELHLSGLNWTAIHPVVQKIPENWILFLKISYIGSLNWEKIPQTAVLTSYIFTYK